MKLNDPPSDLSAEAQSLWKRIVERDISPSRATMLGEALRCLDRLRQVQGELATAKLTTVTPRTGAVHVNPLLKIETELRRQFSSMWLGMNLHFIARIDGSLRNLTAGQDADGNSE